MVIHTNFFLSFFRGLVFEKHPPRFPRDMSRKCPPGVHGVPIHNSDDPSVLSDHIFESPCSQWSSITTTIAIIDLAFLLSFLLCRKKIHSGNPQQNIDRATRSRLQIRSPHSDSGRERQKNDRANHMKRASHNRYYRYRYRVTAVVHVRELSNQNPYLDLV